MSDVVFEAYGAGDGQAHLRLPWQLHATDISDAAILHAMDVSMAATGYATQDGEASLTRPPTRLLASAAQNMGLLRLEPTQVVAVSSALVPTIAVAMLSLRSTAVQATGYTINHGEGDLKAPTRLLALGFDGGAGLLRVPLQTTALPAFMVRNYVLMEAEVAMLSLVEEGRTAMVETLALGVDVDMQQVMVRQALLALGDTPATLLDGLSKITETLTFDHVALVVWQMLHTEALALDGDAALINGILIQMAEALALAGGPGTQLDGLSAVVDALALGEVAGYAWPVSVTEALGVGETPVSTLLAANRKTDMLGLSADAAGFASFAMLAPETLALGEAGGTTAELLNQIHEGMAFLVRVSLPDGEYLAWVCNTESRAFTTYRNFPFNSFCEIGGQYYGATDTGIYLLEGDDDAGAPIAARIRTGLTDMGVAKLKRGEAMYLGYRATGDLVLKVVTTSDHGEKAESWYSLEPRPAADMREGRVKIGKGLKSLYWGFEVANVDGADFALDKISFLPMVLERKI